MNAPARSGLRDLMRDHRPLVMPIASFPGAQLTGASVRQLVTDAAAQAEAILALHARFRTRVLLTCMDLSVEAEAFGGETRFAEDEVPVILGRRITDSGQAKALAIPEVGTARTALQLDVIHRLVRHAGSTPILAGVTGPFSLAARLLGVSEALVLTADDPDLVHAVVEKCAGFLARLLVGLRDAGASGVFMAEPTAGLISPRGLANFSAPYIRRMIATVADSRFTVLLHNCAAKPAHLPAILEAGAGALHFGAPMDLAAALRAAPVETPVCGNLDPAAGFVSGTPESVAAAVRELLQKAAGHPNYVLSSGCDLPRRTPLENLGAFFAAAG